MALAPTQSLVETPSRAFYRRGDGGAPRRGEFPFWWAARSRSCTRPASTDPPRTSTSSSGRPTCSGCSRLCAAAGYDAELVFSHWLAKIRSADGFIDVIFSSGNGIAVGGRSRGSTTRPSRTCSASRCWIAPAEETLWSKAFVMERERFDGADVAHIILACGERLDWRRLVERFGPHWRVLLAHLVLFGFIYPSARSRVPVWRHGGAAGPAGTEADAPMPPSRSATARCSPGRSTWATCSAAISGMAGSGPTAA